MPTPRSSLTVGVIDGVLYAIGGIKPGVADTYYSTVEAYDPPKNSWTTKASLPAPCWGAAAGVIDGTIYVVGCPDFPFGARANLAYNPKTDKWSSRAPMPTPRQRMAAAVANGHLYAIGGVTVGFSNTNHAVVEAYDPKTDTWSTKSPMPTPRCCMAVGVTNGLIYVAGGTRFIGHGGVDTPGNLEVYDPKNDTWTTKSPMPIGRGGSAGAVVDSKLYVAGGIAAPLYVDLIQPTVNVYDPETDSWNSIPTMPTARAFAAAGSVRETLYVVGGLGINDSENPHGRTLSVNEAFSPFLHVGIDIKPGDAQNTLNLKSQGVVGVAILGSGTFDPLSVDPTTVRLAGAPVATKGKGQPMASQGDFNRDGYTDLLLYFRTQDMTALIPPVGTLHFVRGRAPALQQTEAVLYGTTTTGQRIRGADTLRIVRYPLARSNFPSSLDRPRSFSRRPN